MKMSKSPNFLYLIPANSWIKIFFQNSCCVTFFTFLTPKFQKVLRSSLWDIWSWNDWHTWQTEEWTNKGDYYGLQQVNLGSNIFVYIIVIIYTPFKLLLLLNFTSIPHLKGVLDLHTKLLKSWTHYLVTYENAKPSNFQPLATRE